MNYHIINKMTWFFKKAFQIWEIKENDIPQNFHSIIFEKKIMYYITKVN